MGKLLALSLLCTIIGAVFFQPVLMGRPRQIKPVDALVAGPVEEISEKGEPPP
jgi:hypothetical protein